MELSPIDVQQKTFRAALRGYAEEEVDDFLDQVVETLRGYEQRLADAEERVAALEQELAANRETEEAIKRTFVAAQRTHDEMLEEARTDAARILSEARDDAERQLAEARLRAVRLEEDHVKEKGQLTEELSILRSVVADLKSRLQALALSSLEQLEEVAAALSAPDLPEEQPQPVPEMVGDHEPPVAEEEPTEEQVAVSLPEEEAVEEEEPRETSLAGNLGRAAYLRRPRTRRPWERDEE